jgi:hypothetical protein
MINLRKYYDYRQKTASSLSIMLNNNGFKIIKIFTKTQLFQGFLNLDHLDIEKSSLGSDVTCIA